MQEISQYPNLFQPISIGSMKLKNRIIMLPMHLRLDPRTERGYRFYKDRAEGGISAIISWATLVDLVFSDEIWKKPGGAQDFMASLSRIIEGVHSSGVKIGMQLAHFNALPPELAFSGSWLGEPTGEEVSEWVAPSARIEPEGFVHGGAPPGIPLREMTVKEIELVIEKFGKAAAGAKKAGFDFVEIHGAHGTLPCQFLSPIDNRRTDRYGNDLNGRMQFGIECVESIRSATSDEFPVFFRIPAMDFDTRGGITLNEGTAFAVALEEAGVDCIDVSVGTTTNQPYWKHASPGPKMKPGTWSDLAKQIRSQVRVPVIAVGRIHSPDIAETILSNGEADLIGIGRQLIADPDWPNKVKEGHLDQIVKCTSCNRNCWSGIAVDLPPDASLCNENEGNRS
ncbi:NADH:flavin oxidoreductase [Chloroflexota bacterium]